MRSIRKIAIAVAAVSALSMTAACGADSSDASSDTAASDTSASASQSPEDMSSDDMSSDSESEGDMSEDAAMDPAANLVGPGCDDYAEQVPDGAGSVAGMAEDPVAVAASNNPLLTTLVAAVSGKLNPKVDLVDTLNGGEFTVFAPVDDAFKAKAVQDALPTLSKPKGAAALTSILTYHVVPGQISPADITGTQKTVQGGTVKVTGSGDNLKVNGANVICGGVHTANATVYLIDQVLMPKM
jgi:uncharacterized surface protein with fasciclin (FAS1) repeats